MSKVIRIDEEEFRKHLGEFVKGTGKETLDAMLDAEADELCGAYLDARRNLLERLHREQFMLPHLQVL